MENTPKKFHLNKRPLTIVFVVICAIAMLVLIVPWCRRVSFGNAYYISPLAYDSKIGHPLATITLVVLIVDMFLLMSDFFVIDSKHRMVIRIVSVALLGISILFTGLCAMGPNLPVN